MHVYSVIKHVICTTSLTLLINQGDPNIKNYKVHKIIFKPSTPCLTRVLIINLFVRLYLNQQNKYNSNLNSGFCGFSLALQLHENRQCLLPPVNSKYHVHFHNALWTRAEKGFSF
jgi:hypothetical protein